MNTNDRFLAATSWLAAVLAGVVGAGTAAPAPPGAPARAAGLAILQATSIEPADAQQPFGDSLVRFRVLGVMEEPPGGPAVPAGATINKRIPPNRRRIRPASEVLSRNHVYLARIHWDNGSLAAGLRTAMAIRAADKAEEPQRIAEYESKAFRRDVLKLRSAPTPSAQAAAFAKLAASTPSPSGATRVALVEMPPHGGARPGPACAGMALTRGTLRGAAEWFAHTPVVLTLEDGVVVTGTSGPLRTSENARRPL